MAMNRYIRFDWAAKYMLRRSAQGDACHSKNKADFAIFEGLISVLVKEKVTIVELLDTESNKETKDDKYNRVDIKAKNSKGEIILVEIQQTREHDTLVRDTDVMRTPLLEAEIKGRKKGMAEGRAEGRAEGEKVGRAEGEKKGRAEVKAEVALKLKAKGFSLTEIAELTGLSEADIAQL